jgi:hypothetical protein
MNEDLVTKTLLELKEQIGQMVTQKEFSQFKEQISRDHDTMIKILERLDQKRTILHYDLKKLENDQKETKADVAKIKVQLKMA